MGKQKGPYPEAFRREAVELFGTSDKNLTELAADLGISRETLRLWVKQADVGAGRRDDAPTNDERAELARLRRENRVLREEREILREAAAFFANENNGTR